MKRLFVFLLLNACMVDMAMSQIIADSVRILFQPGSSRIKPGSSGNALHVFAKKVRRCDNDGSLERLVVRAYTSPDGVSTANLQLSADRCQSVADYIISNAKIDADRIDSYPCGIAWDKLRCMIASDHHVPGRREVLDIIDYTPVWVHDAQGNISGSRKKSLMDFQGGQTYRWLREHFFEGLHYAVVELYVKKPEKEYNNYIPKDDKPFAIRDLQTEHIIDTTFLQMKFPHIPDGEHTAHRMALKTNLLYAAVLLPSIELEWRLNNRWSMGLEGSIAWWKKQEEHKCYQLAVAGITVRRWFRKGSLREGFYTGAFAGAGLYDLENGKKGYRGEGVLAGVSIGYLWPVGRHFAIEAEGGGGWMMTRYKEYIPYEGHHLYVRTQNLNFYGPLRLKLSLIWLLGTAAHYNKKEEGERK
ncbi:hypothetical protein C799_03190 [Bacteroides thetaiotaomicron dnLKV9]|mgnify:CR=1 FL=1|uniref:OmpA-like domain-containing protein n=1 Tax=Bacteroides thetaiotaomicron dnLKV9 TaxID=1235785 RepID=R9H695_BACT4|nr:DUF3575 domain-containing protein [Bacteroides thetaiotaomicron]EOR99310.1 hypothetical protein C799_03190 [Bacteroides thetaiotaomicron dnLKV9]